MKINVSKQAYDQFDEESRRQLKPVPCSCIEGIAKGTPAADCEACSGSGTVYEWSLSPEDSAAIQDNLRSQGVPLGKIGTH